MGDDDRVRTWKSLCIRCTFDECAACSSGAQHTDTDTGQRWRFVCTCTHAKRKGRR